ncbi:MAG TPA: hypothetical protein VMY39_09250 [Planctomycetota bacterium]|nr:hypothetical protein [Planctomycetota bacterium]
MRPEERSKVWQWWMRVLRSRPGCSRKPFGQAVDRLLDDPETEVLVAELSAVPGEPLGFVARQGSGLLMVFVLAQVNGVKSRRRGFATALLNASAEGMEHVEARYHTPLGRALMGSWQRSRRRAA